MPNLTGLLSMNGRELILQSQLWVYVMPCGCLDSHTFKHFEIFSIPVQPLFCHVEEMLAYLHGSYVLSRYCQHIREDL